MKIQKVGHLVVVAAGFKAFDPIHDSLKLSENLRTSCFISLGQFTCRGKKLIGSSHALPDVLLWSALSNMSNTSFHFQKINFIRKLVPKLISTIDSYVVWAFQCDYWKLEVCRHLKLRKQLHNLGIYALPGILLSSFNFEKYQPIRPICSQGWTIPLDPNAMLLHL
jgi:hypothetical protein